jgi:hypothetical protein
MATPAPASSSTTAGHTWPLALLQAALGTTVGLVCPWLTGGVAVGSNTGVAVVGAGASASGVDTGVVTGAAEFGRNHDVHQ